MPSRKGARSIKEIPADILLQLNRGLMSSANLVEWLAVDKIILLKVILEELQLMEHLVVFEHAIDQLPKTTVNTINQCIGVTFLTISKQQYQFNILEFLSTHQSDTVRCWACYLIAFDEALALHQKFEDIKRMAQDEHFGVREVAWMAIRPQIISNLDASIQILSNWSFDDNPNIRRFATEATRPRGVWCAHINDLKSNPEKALSILTPLMTDESKYVQDSVGNWLNDAAKSKPEFVQQFCEEFSKKFDTKATKYIVKRGLRGI